jgi:SAM-dependent methyltransferase
MKVARTYKRGRLCYFQCSADADYWERHWKASINEASYLSAVKGKLGYFRKTFVKYLPKGGKIIEAGCGMGQYVLSLRVCGYDAEGVEWSAGVVDLVRKMKPELPIRVGDVTKLDVPDGYYEGYISLGVVEHRKEGPEPFIAEAYRVLAPGGVACISVPHLNALRRWKARRDCYNERTEGLGFYQYAFGDEEMERLLRDAGFAVVSRHSYGAYKGLKDELPLIRHLGNMKGIGSFLQRAIDRGTPSWIAPLFSHMRMFICTK